MNNSKLDSLNDLFDLCNKAILGEINVRINFKSIEDLFFNLDFNLD